MDWLLEFLFDPPRRRWWHWPVVILLGTVLAVLSIPFLLYVMLGLKSRRMEQFRAQENQRQRELGAQRERLRARGRVLTNPDLQNLLAQEQSLFFSDLHTGELWWVPRPPAALALLSRTGLPDDELIERAQAQCRELFDDELGQAQLLEFPPGQAQRHFENSLPEARLQLFTARLLDEFQPNEPRMVFVFPAHGEQLFETSVSAVSTSTHAEAHAAPLRSFLPWPHWLFMALLSYLAVVLVVALPMVPLWSVSTTVEWSLLLLKIIVIDLFALLPLNMWVYRREDFESQQRSSLRSIILGGVTMFCLLMSGVQFIHDAPPGTTERYASCLGMHFMCLLLWRLVVSRYYDWHAQQVSTAPIDFTMNL